MREHKYSSKLHPSLSPLLGAGGLSASRPGRITPLERTPVPVSVIRVVKTNLGHYLSSVYFINQPLHVSGIFIAHHQEVYCTYSNGTCCVFSTHSTGVWVSPEPVWTFLRKEKSLASGSIPTMYRLRYPDSQCVAGCTSHPQVSLLPS